jgi:cell division protease FtsH
LQAALLAGRTNKALVGREEFSAAVLRSVAGIEKKRSILQGMEKEVVARHEVRSGRHTCSWAGFRGLA